MSGPRSTEAKQSVWLDVFRVLLLAQVVLGHIAALGLPDVGDLPQGTMLYAVGFPFKLVTRFGPQAAVLFIFVSGYLVGGSLLQSRLAGHRVSLASFLSRRVFRIVPTLLAALALTAVLDGAAIYLFGYNQIYAGYRQYDMVDAFNLTTFIGNMLGLQPTLVQSFGSNGPLWTLGYIVQFYVVGYVLIVWASRRSWAMVLAGMLVLAVIPLRLEWVLFFAVWFVGAAWRMVPWRLPALPSLGLAISLLILANLWSSPFAAFCLAVSGCAFIAWTRSTDLQTPPWLVAISRRAAELSYPAYAVHFPVAMILNAWLLAGNTASTPVMFFLFAILVCSATMIVSTALTWLLSPLTSARQRTVLSPLS